MQMMMGMGLVLVWSLTVAGCDTAGDTADTAPPADAGEGPATPPADDRDAPVRVQMIDRGGAHVGEATLTETAAGVEIALRVDDMEPGIRGFHVHETPQCDPPDFESAGGHFNPDDREHGFDNPQGPHAGDLPNFRIGPDGSADTTFVNENLVLRNGERSLLPGGGALLIHTEEDDYETDPAGDAGDRIACGVIEADSR